MIKLINLFQRKADHAMQAYKDALSKAYAHPTHTPEHNAGLQLAAIFKMEQRTWQTAADILRKEVMHA